MRNFIKTIHLVTNKFRCVGFHLINDGRQTNCTCSARMYYFEGFHDQKELGNAAPYSFTHLPPILYNLAVANFAT
jgi:hypothetical protein